MKRRRYRIAGWASALAAGLGSSAAWAQAPVPPTGPAACQNCQPAQSGGPLHRAIHHIGFTLQDKLIGYPDQFVEPPLGFFVYESIGQMKARAENHQFTLYRSDFIDGSTTLSPIGAQRLSLMAARLPCWLGPVVVEWTPDRPGLAESRRSALVATLQGAGLPIVPERVMVGPSIYPGMLGTDASNNYANMILRDQQAPATYSLTPTSTESFGQGAR